MDASFAFLLEFIGREDLEDGLLRDIGGEFKSKKDNEKEMKGVLELEGVVGHGGRRYLQELLTVFVHQDNIAAKCNVLIYRY